MPPTHLEITNWWAQKKREMIELNQSLHCFQSKKEYLGTKNARCYKRSFLIDWRMPYCGDPL